MAYFRSGISNIQKFKGTTVDVTGLPSPIASFRSNVSGVKLDSLKVLVEAVQSGSGTPSPDNVRPITGWSGANVTRAGVNVWGGEKMANDTVNAINNTSACNIGEDSVGKYFFLQAGMIINGVYLFTKFKPNTRYTVILKCSKENNPSNSSVNLNFLYSDGTVKEIKSPAYFSDENVQTFAFTSDSGKSIVAIRGGYYNGRSRIYYEDSGVFEGVITTSDFSPYNGNTYTIAFGDTYYGGELDVTNGVLRVVKGIVDMGSLTWVRAGNTNRFYADISDGASSIVGGRDAVCEIYIVFKGVLTDMPDKSITTFNSNISGVNGRVFVLDTDYTNATALKTAMSGVQLVYELATPIEIQLTPQQIEQLAENNIWADTGDVSECKYIQISQIGG